MKVNEVGRLRKLQRYYSFTPDNAYHWNESLLEKIMRGDKDGRAYDSFKKLVTEVVCDTFGYTFVPNEVIPRVSNPLKPSVKEEYWPSALTAVYIVKSNNGKYLFEESSFCDAKEGECLLFPSNCEFQMMGSTEPIVRLVVNFDVQREST
tara:strand:+ start:275 stop:724 length:450 start_codon:yes stop_codon:yes gene_type:complete